MVRSRLERHSRPIAARPGQGTSMQVRHLRDFLKAAAVIGGAGTPLLLARYARMVRANRSSLRVVGQSIPAPAAHRSEPIRPADIIIPVYNNCGDTARLLNALSRDAGLGGRIVIIDDASTDALIAPMLRSFASQMPNCILLTHETNSGFVGACNNGFANSRNDIVILNTDIDLPRGALRRMVAHLQADATVATVTPLSNCAYGVGFPHLVYPGGQAFRASASDIDAAFASLRPTAPVELATGVGFCMAVSRAALERLKGFDTSFGQGYGEETDFCQRAVAAGMRNVLAPDVFVAHTGGQSFGGDWQLKSRRGLLRVLKKHPGYAARVARYLERSEVLGLNLAALVALAERLSGRQAYIDRGDGAAGTLAAGQPHVLICDVPEGAEVRVTWKGETHILHLASRVLVEDALAMRPPAAA